jgi:hypothetical protein
MDEGIVPEFFPKELVCKGIRDTLRLGAGRKTKGVKE